MSFISPAYAQAAGGAGAGGLEAMFPLLLIFVVFYFLLIRPQQKKAKAHKAMLESVRRGDKIVTGGGVIGTVNKVIDESEISVEIADGVKVRVQRGLLAAVLSKTEPIVENKKVKKNKKSGKHDGDTN
jgi:preprotein translocase subunit YajC